jgi:hypothetical protein
MSFVDYQNTMPLEASQFQIARAVKEARGADPADQRQQGLLHRHASDVSDYVAFAGPLVVKDLASPWRSPTL